MQLGFVGLGKMGGNMVHRIHRDSDHDVRGVRLQRRGGRRGGGPRRDRGVLARGPRLEARGARARSGSWCPSGEPTQKTVDKLAELLDEGDTIIDGGNSRWTDDKARAGGARAEGHPLRGRRHERRRLGPAGGLLHDGRRPRRGGRAARADPRRARAAGRRGARPGLGPLRADRRGPLREDGPQRRSSTG